MKDAFKQLQSFPDPGITIQGLNEKTTIQQLIDYIKKKGDIAIEKKDIYILKPDYREGAHVRITCSSEENAYKLVDTLNLSVLEGSKLIAEVLVYLKGIELTNRGSIKWKGQIKGKGNGKGKGNWK